MGGSRSIAFEVIRLALAVWVTLTLVFLAFQVWSVSPSLSLIPHDPKYAGFAQQNADIFALGQPVWTRYGVWLADVFLGRLGISYSFQLPVLDVLYLRLPATLELVIGTTLWAVVLGSLLGWAAAGRRMRGLGSGFRLAGLVLYGLPLFWAAILLLVGASEAWQLNLGTPLPLNAARAHPTGFPVLDAFLSGDLNQAWLVFGTTALLTLPAGAAMALPILLRVRDGLRLARAGPAFAHLPVGKGLPPTAVFRAALAPIVSGVAAIIPLAVSAAFFIEWVSGRRGLGWYIVLGLNTLDTPLLQGAITLLALLAIVSVLPFAFLEAGFLRQPVTSAPRMVADESAVAPAVRAAGRRLRPRQALAFWAGLVLLAIPLLLAALAPVLSPYGPLQRVTDTACNPGGPPFLQPPCFTHPLGTNFFGLDVFSQVLQGGLLVMAETAQALAVSVGIALGLGLLCGVVGRWADVPLRLILGSISILPGLVVLFLFFATGVLGFEQGWLVVALGLVFVPIVFRDAQRLVAPVERPLLLLRADRRPSLAPSDRLRAAVSAIAPGLVARIPRRLAEMGLLFELFAFFGTLPPTAVDWAQITAQAMKSNAFALGNWGWMVMPGLLLFLYVTGLLLISDGLRIVLMPDPRDPEPGPATALTEAASLTLGAANP